MLDFKVDLQSDLFHNVEAMRATMRRCKLEGMEWEECYKTLKEQFSHLNNQQYMEVAYENHESFCAINGRERQRHWDYQNEHAEPLRRMLDARNKEGFDYNSVDDLFDNLRDTRNLVGKKISIQLTRFVRKDKDEE